MDTTDKHNQLPKRATVHSPQQLCFEEEALDLSNLYVIGQLGYFPVMSKMERQVKHQNRGVLVCYLGRDQQRHIYTETADGAIKRYRESDFHPYYTGKDPSAVFSDTIRHTAFDNQDGPTEERASTEDTGEADTNEKTEMYAK